MHIPSLKDEIHPDEWQLRCDLAACYRLVALYGMSDLVFTHISAKLPESVAGPEHQFLINPYGLMFEEITASSLVKVDMQCQKLHDSPFPVNAHMIRIALGCALALALSAPAYASSFAGTSAGAGSASSGASSGSTSGNDKVVLQAREDAAGFVASDGRIRGARLEAALRQLRADSAEARAASDMELARAILAR